MSQSKSNSNEQQKIEGYMLEKLNEKEGLNLQSQKLKLSDGTYVQLDGFDEKNNAICEMYAHIGSLKGAQPDKVASDFLKMLLVEKNRGCGIKKYFCFADEEAAKKVKGSSWLASVAKQFCINIVVIELPENKKDEILKAQKRQDITK